MLTKFILPKSSKDYPETFDNRAILEELETVQERLSSEEASEYIASLDTREKRLCRKKF
ncbi:hypothetical protein IFO70_36150 [Phormidium tenue FACHB-886]|nr:hypothetical protein [Phormidium tenue FACHB-886]